ncbi:MAG: extracellular solute-binding protein [Clostridia bacterium]|nr:extracellular solute-binding protein [Clostridia bacterium]
MKQWIAVLLTLVLLLTPMTAAAQTESNTPPVENDLATTPVIMGDVSRDGNIGADDALRVLQSCVGKIISFDPHDRYNDAPGAGIAADVDGDGVIRAADALQILQKVVGKIDRFPADAGLYGQNLTLKTFFADRYRTEPYASFIDKLEQQYGMTLTVVPYGDSLQEDLQSGKETADVLELNYVFARNMGREGHLVNLQGLPNQLGDDLLTRATGFGRHLYGVGFELQEGGMQGIFYNKTLLNQVAPDYDLNALYAEGKWDFATLRELTALATKDTDQDGKPNLYGITANAQLLEMAFVAGGGLSCLEYNNEAGVEKPDVYVKENISAQLETAPYLTLQEMRQTDKSWLYKADTAQCIEVFTEGQALLFAGYVSYSDQILGNADFEVGFIPMVKAEIDSYQTVAGTVFSVPKGKKEKASAAIALATQLQLMNPYVKQQVKQQYLQKGLDETSAQHVADLPNKATLDYSVGVVSLEQLSSAPVPAVVTGETPMQRIVRQFQSELDEYYMPFYDFIIFD